MRNIKSYFFGLILCASFAMPLEAKELSQAPDFTLNDTRQESVTLSSYKGKSAVLLFFWATWCPFCREELKTLNSRYADLVKDNVEVLAIDIGESQYRVEKFIRSYALLFRMLLDKDSSVAYSYDIVGVPTLVLIDKKGKVVFQGHTFPKEYKKLLAN